MGGAVRNRGGSNPPPVPRREPSPDIGPLPNMPLPPIPVQQDDQRVPQQPLGDVLPDLPPIGNLPLPNVPRQPRPGNLPPPPDEQRKRRWTINACRAFGLPDVKGQNQILGSAVATCARIDETRLQPGTAATLPPDTTNDRTWAIFVEQVRFYENVKQPRETEDGQQLRDAARQARQSAANAQPPVPAKLAAIDDVLSALKAFELRDKITALGRPPWNQTGGQDAAQAKVELDLLSIPRDQRTMTVQGGGVNPSFWVNRTSAQNGGTPVRSFLCKPASTQGGMVNPIPVGGEVAREGLTDRAGKLLGGAIKLGVDIPETQVVSLPPSFFPDPIAQRQGDQTCSVQEAKSAKGALADLKQQDKAKIPPEQCAGIAFLDLMTLNTDRHRENLLVDHSGGLVPIDHGLTFPSDDEDGKSRIAGAISGPHNALLRLPGTHAPMTPEMALSLQNLDPRQLRAQLGQAQQEIGNQHNAMAGKISDGSLDMSLAATRFMKIAGGITARNRKTKEEVRLSPGAVQVAFGLNSAELLALPPPKDDEAERAFDEVATRVLTEALRDQEVTAQVAQFDFATYTRMSAELKALGWKLHDGTDSAGEPGLQNDPAICAKLIAAGMKCPKKNVRMSNQIALARQLLAERKKPVEPKDALKAAVDLELRTIGQIAEMLPANVGKPVLKQIKSGKKKLREDDTARRTLLEKVRDAAARVMTGELDTMRQTWNIPDNDFNVAWFQKALKFNDVIDAENQMKFFRAEIAKGNRCKFPRKV